MAVICYILAILCTCVLATRSHTTCGEIENIPSNAKMYVAPDYSYFLVFCNNGYSVEDGGSYVACKDGQWERLTPKCVKNSTNVCVGLSAPENGRIECQEGPLYAGVGCRFRCSEGYRISGVNLRLCLSSLKWSGKQPRCIEKSKNVCTGLSAPENGEIECQKGPLYAGAECRFRCNEGYKISGVSLRRCLSSLEWSRSQPWCTEEEAFVQSETPQRSQLQPRKSYPVHIPEKNPPSSYQQPVSYSQKPHISPTRRYPPGIYRHGTSGAAYHSRRNHCNLNKGGCEQICDFKNGQVECSCDRGYDLAQDRKRCVEQPSDHSEKSKMERQHQPHASYPEKISPSPGRQPELQESHLFTPHYNPSGTNERLETGGATYLSNRNPCNYNKGGCEQICNFRDEQVQCSCFGGYRIARDGERCVEQPSDHSEKSKMERQHQPHASYPEKISPSPARHPELQESHLFTPQYNPSGTNERLETGGATYLSNRNPCNYNKGGCEQICNFRDEQVQCSCFGGYRIAQDGERCVDINECNYETLNRCQHKCVNHAGGYSCKCNRGYRLVDKFKCEGCKKNSYWLPQERRCERCPDNSYTDSDGKRSINDCRCLPGYSGNPEENMLCEDIDECAEENFGCSHKCVNTPGSVFCSCHVGFTVDSDRKTCIDIDECSIKNGGCQGICHNTNGSFHCSCPEGFVNSNKDQYTCVDVDECLENNGGCAQKCNNYPGGYYCSCEEGFRLDIGLQTCTDIRCSGRPPPHHSTRRCKKNGEALPYLDSYPVGTVCSYSCYDGFKNAASAKRIECLLDGTWKGSLPNCQPQFCRPLPVPENGEVHPSSCSKEGNAVKQRCTFTCHPGYQTKDEVIFTCQKNLQWTPRNFPVCKPVEIVPYMKCPDDIFVDLLPGKDTHNITVPEPITNVKTFVVHPYWVVPDETIELPAGITEVVFKANDTDFSSFPQCTTSIHVIDKEAPVFNFCPESLKIEGAGLDGVQVTWKDPIVTDNVGIEHLIPSLKPNSTLSVGTYTVEYMAKDFAGNTASCSFEINVAHTHCRNLEDPANGVTSCTDWVVGKFCQAVCNPGYAQHPTTPIIHSCDESGNWEPSDIIADCLPYIPTTSSTCPPGYDFAEHRETEEDICIQIPAVAVSVRR